MAEGTFEDKFMDIQSGMVALAWEAAGDDDVEVVYLYGSIEGGMTSFNTFFRVNGLVKGLADVITDRTLVFRVLDLGTEDLGRLRALCNEYSRECPTEIRGRYETTVLLQCLFGGLSGVFPQCGLMFFPGVVIVLG